MKQLTPLLILISWFLLFSPGSVFPQEDLKQHKSEQDKIVEKIMDLSNRDYDELAKYLQDRDLIIENKLITIMLDNNLGERPQRRAVWALGVIGSDEVIDLFLEKLRDKELDIYARHDMADVLGDHNLERTIDPLIEIFNDKEMEPIVRRRISNALAKMKSIKAVDPLIKALDEDDQYIREGAVYALGKIGTNRATNILVDLLEDENADVRRTANSMLRSLRPDKKVGLLLGSLEDDFIYHSESAVNELSALGDIVVDELHKEIISKSDFIRWQILRILGRIKSEKSVNLFLELINDKDEDIRNECAVGLAEIKSDVSVMPLIKMLDSHNSDIKETAAWVLSEIGSEEAVKPLVNLLDDGKSGWFAAMSLGKIGNRTAIGSLEIFQKSENNKSRRAAIWAIERINNKYSDQKTLVEQFDYCNKFLQYSAPH
ncbi:MAG: HEAT repeat domain-containing protein, partial [Candidatus Aminicenantes bacterium]|nr:HEAT repeat domain-containing protein [Candidatus Aminicenantes bacterium]